VGAVQNRLTFEEPPLRNTDERRFVGGFGAGSVAAGRTVTAAGATPAWPANTIRLLAAEPAVKQTGSADAARHRPKIGSAGWPSMPGTTGPEPVRADPPHGPH